MGKPKHPTTSVVLHPELRNKVKEVAKAQNKNFSEVVTEALKLWLEYNY